MLKLALLSFAVWASTFVIYLFGIFITAAVLESARTSTAEIAVPVLIAAEFIIAGLAITFVFVRSRGVLSGAMRILWIGVFAVVQIGIGAVALLTTFVALNR
jgi:hypothetical protein